MIVFFLNPINIVVSSSLITYPRVSISNKKPTSTKASRAATSRSKVKFQNSEIELYASYVAFTGGNTACTRMKRNNF